MSEKRPADEEVFRDALRASPECLPIEILSQRLILSAEDSGRQAVERHLEQCLHCRTEVDLMREFESGVVKPDEARAVGWIAARLAKSTAVEPATVRAATWWSPRLLAGFGAAAALVVLAIGLGTQWNSRVPGTPVPEFGEERMRSRRVEIVNTPGALEWKPVSGAANYEITARLVDGSIIFHNLITKQVLVYPSEIATTVNTGKLVLWEVVARDAAGNELARSGIQKLKH